MDSDSDYYYKKSSFKISQTTINIIIVILLFVFFFFLFNYCSKNYFTNINSSTDNKIDDLKNELAFVKEELFNKNSYKSFEENNYQKIKEEKLKENVIEDKSPKNPKIYNTDLLLNGNINITYPEPNINMDHQNDYVYYNNIPDNNLPDVQNNNDVVIQQVAPPIIYDPIENYDRLKLLDPLVDPRGRSSADQIPTPQVAAQLNFPTQGILDRYHRVGLLVAINKHERRNNRRNKYEDFSSYEDFGNIETDSHEDFGNIEKVVKGKKINVDSDTNSSHYDNSSRLSRYSDSSSDLQTISSSYDTKFKEKIIPNNVILDIGDRDNDILELIGKKIAHDWYRYFTSISKGNKIIKINVHNRNRKELYDGDVVYIPILKRHYKVKLDKLDMIEYNPYFF